MRLMTWWLRITGLLYVVNGSMMAFVKAPIRSAGPPGILDRSSAGDSTAQFLIDTWIGFGLEVIAIGIVLLLVSSRPQLSIGLVWTVIAIEIARGLLYDGYMLSRGYPTSVYVPWLAIHIAIIATGVLALRQVQPKTGSPGVR